MSISVAQRKPAFIASRTWVIAAGEPGTAGGADRFTYRTERTRYCRARFSIPKYSVGRNTFGFERFRVKISLTSSWVAFNAFRPEAIDDSCFLEGRRPGFIFLK